MHGTLISRRCVLKRCAALALPFAARYAEGQSGSVGHPGTATGDLPVRLVKELKYANLLDISPDGRKLCVYCTRHPVRSFVWRGSWKEKQRPVRDGEEALRVIEIDSWKSTYATRFPAIPFYGSFFADSEALYAEVPGAGAGRTDHVTIDLRTGKKEERFDPYNREVLSYDYHALDGGTLLGGGRNGRNQTEVLTRVELPSYKEIQRVPFAEKPRANFGTSETDITVSADRKTFVYSVDNVVICRRAADLAVQWTRPTEPVPAYDPKVQRLGLWVCRTAVLANGGLVAASLFNPATEELAKKGYVGIYNGKDGAPVARVPANGMEGIAISSDGKLLAAGQLIRGVQPTIELYDIASGRRLATLIHDRFRDAGRDALVAEFGTHGIQFTPNGKYLITSGLHTRIWELGRS